jgi:hypothetical protein
LDLSVEHFTRPEMAGLFSDKAGVPLAGVDALPASWPP